MRSGWGVLVVCLSPAVMAQSTPLEPVSLRAPAPEAGWTVVQFDNGYARWKDDTSADETESGGVQVVPSRVEGEKSAPPEAKQEQQAAERPMARQARTAACETEKRKLAVRLLELRGIDAPPETAPLVLAAAEAPLRPSAWAGVPGLGPGTGSSLLVTAYSSDLIARDLVDDLARCLEREGTSTLVSKPHHPHH